MRIVQLDETCKNNLTLPCCKIGRSERTRKVKAPEGGDGKATPALLTADTRKLKLMPLEFLGTTTVMEEDVAIAALRE